jgi:hypothetical protein
MLKKILIAFSAVILALIVAWALASPTAKFKPGDAAPPVATTSIQGMPVEIPAAQSRWVHLQFRRFASCAICNLHLKKFVDRHAELTSAGIREVVVFHSPKESLLPFQGKFPFDVVADPEKKLYEQFGVGTSIFSILDFRAWPAISEGLALQDKPQGKPEGGALGLPADFLIAADGKVVASHYGRHSYDQWSVDQLLALAR